MEFLRPLQSSAPVEQARRAFRRVVAAWREDRELHRDLERARGFLRHPEFVELARSLA